MSNHERQIDLLMPDTMNSVGGYHQHPDTIYRHRCDFLDESICIDMQLFALRIQIYVSFNK